MVLLVLTASSAQAIDLGYQLDIGLGQTQDTGENTASLIPMGGKFNYGYRLMSWFSIGSSIDLRYVAQVSEANEEKDNFQGIYYSLFAPHLNFNFGSIGLIAEVPLHGEHQFLSTNEQGDTITMYQPSGFRATFTYKGEMSSTTWGFFYENLSFTKQKGGFAGDTEILDGQDISQFGVSLIFPFGDELGGGGEVSLD